MKTIHDAATERSIYYESNPYCDFKAGAEFAQQWISVEDELPERQEETYRIIVKAEHKYEVIREIRRDAFHYEIEYIFSREGYTHWRPIERK